MKKIIAGLVFSVLSMAAQADFITPESVSSDSEFRYSSTPDILIKDALDTSYVSPSPESGGYGTALYTGDSDVSYVFNFDGALTIDGVYLWDYYNHTPTQWKLTFFSEKDAVGSHVDVRDIDLGQTAQYISNNNYSKFHDVSFSQVDNVKSIRLENTNDSSFSGVGVAEIHFSGQSFVSDVSAFSFGSMLFGAGLFFRAKKK